MRRHRNRAAIVGLVALLGAACSTGVDDSAKPKKSATSAAVATTTAPVEAEPVPHVQHMWLYQRVGTVDEDGTQVDLTDGIIENLPTETTSVDMGNGVKFVHHEALGARMVGPDGTTRDDVEVIAGVLHAGDDRPLAVIATPDLDSSKPIGADDHVQVAFTHVSNDLDIDDPLFVDVAFVQATEGESDDNVLDGAELFGARLAAGQGDAAAASSEDDADGTTMLAFSTELGSAIDTTWADLPAVSQRAMDGFARGTNACTAQVECVENYLEAALSTPEPPATPEQQPLPVAGGRISGDPHVSTFDTRAYDMQAVGEFVAARSDDLEVQIRTEAIEGSSDVSVLSGVAVGVDDHELVWLAEDVFLDGKLLGVDELEGDVAVGDGVLSRRGNGYELTTASGASVVLGNVWSWALDLWVGLPDENAGGFVGLLGDNDGDVDNDLTARDGTIVIDPDFDEFYATFVDSWRLSDDESLFVYGDGETTATFTDASLPTEAVTLDSIPVDDRTRAVAVCELAGVVDQVVLDECVLDYAFTGEIGFVRVSITVDTVEGVWSGRLLPDGSVVDGAEEAFGPEDEGPDSEYRPENDPAPDEPELGPGPDDGHGPDEGLGGPGDDYFENEGLGGPGDDYFENEGLGGPGDDYLQDEWDELDEWDEGFADPDDGHGPDDGQGGPGPGDGHGPG